MDEKYVTKLTSADLTFLRDIGAYSLPDNPSDKNLSAAQIKQKLYAPEAKLFYWTKNLAEETYSALSEIYGGCKSLSQSISEEISRATESENKISLVANSNTESIKNLQTIDDQSHHFVTDDEGYVCQVLPKYAFDTSSIRMINHEDGVGINSELTLINTSLLALIGIRSDERELIAKILSGELKVGSTSISNKAERDSQGNFINVLDYAKTTTMDYDPATGVITLKLYNQNGAIIDMKTINLPSELVFTDQGYDAATHSLWFKPASGGANITIPLTDLIDTYTKSDTDTCAVTIDNHVISVSVKDGSITLAKMSSALQTTINGWADAEAARVLAEQARAQAEAQRVANEAVRQSRPFLYQDSDGYICIDYGTGIDITK